MKAQIVSFHCVLKNKLGQVLSSSFSHDVINQLDASSTDPVDQSLRSLVAGIQNVHEGERRQFTVFANEAYGPYHPDLVVNIAKSDLAGGDSLVIGSEVMRPMGTKGEKRKYRVTQITSEDTLVLDGNHPLAGHDLIFDIEVVSARDACVEDFEGDPIVQNRNIVH